MLLRQCVPGICSIYLKCILYSSGANRISRVSGSFLCFGSNRRNHWRLFFNLTRYLLVSLFALYCWMQIRIKQVNSLFRRHSMLLFKLFRRIHFDPILLFWWWSMIFIYIDFSPHTFFRIINMRFWPIFIFTSFFWIF